MCVPASLRLTRAEMNDRSSPWNQYVPQELRIACDTLDNMSVNVRVLRVVPQMHHVTLVNRVVVHVMLVMYHTINVAATQLRGITLVVGNNSVLNTVLVFVFMNTRMLFVFPPPL